MIGEIVFEEEGLGTSFALPLPVPADGPDRDAGELDAPVGESQRHRSIRPPVSSDIRLLLVISGHGFVACTVLIRSGTVASVVKRTSFFLLDGEAGPR